MNGMSNHRHSGDKTTPIGVFKMNTPFGQAKALEGFSDSDSGLLQELLGRVYENMTKIQKEGTHK